MDPEARRQIGPLCGPHLLAGRGRPSSSSCEGEKREAFEQVRSVVASSPTLPFDRFFFGKSSSCPSVPLIHRLVEFREAILSLFGR